MIFFLAKEIDSETHVMTHEIDVCRDTLEEMKQFAGMLYLLNNPNVYIQIWNDDNSRFIVSRYSFHLETNGYMSEYVRFKVREMSYSPEINIYKVDENSTVYFTDGNIYTLEIA